MHKQSGSILVMVMFLVVGVAGFCAALSGFQNHSTRMAGADEDQLDLSYMAEAGAAAALAELRSGIDADGDGLGIISKDFGSGSFSVVANADESGDQLTLVSTGTGAGLTRRVEVTTTNSSGGIFWNAIFAGNSEADDQYDMPFGGTNDQADEINGDIYSGNDLSRTDDATINGSVTVTGTATGVSNYEVATQSIPDLRAMGYEVNHDVNVSAVFDSQGYSTYDDAGGTAMQVPESELAHIFRKNPSDRSSEIDGTTKDDYFLEDPYAPVQVDPNENGSNAYHINLNQDNQDPSQDGNNKIYYIDGNMWVHNKKTYSFKFFHSHQDGITVTFVVKGNIYISDNLFLTNQNKDGVLFIAMRDENVEDSGNIYIGDPAFGTVKEMNTFLYAENNFIDQNLDASGSQEFEINGIMSGGNQVNINRDYEQPGYYTWVRRRGKWRRVWVEGGTYHQKMTVTLDQRVKDGDISLPGMPVSTGGSSNYEVLSWITY